MSNLPTLDPSAEPILNVPAIQSKYGELFINGEDAYEKWGVFLGDKALSALMAPVPLKEGISNKSPFKHGRQMLKEDEPCVDERSVTLNLCIIANNREMLYTQMALFYEELRKRRLIIRTKYEPNVYYRMDYQSCTQYTTFNRGIAKYALKLNEPNPNNRTATDQDNYGTSTL